MEFGSGGADTVHVAAPADNATGPAHVTSPQPGAGGGGDYNATDNHDVSGDAACVSPASEPELGAPDSGGGSVGACKGGQKGSRPLPGESSRFISSFCSFAISLADASVLEEGNSSRLNAGRFPGRFPVLHGRDGAVSHLVAVAATVETEVLQSTLSHDGLAVRLASAVDVVALHRSGAH
eukprot:359890-Chlamydomonas_euryale.AAC.3